MNQTLVSVIIPAYNAARFLPEALESVFNQTWLNFEVIVVDDGSTDNTREVLKPYMARITYLQKKNDGTVASVRNMGLRYAHGAFVAFLDADDVWLPEKTVLQMGQMADKSVGMTGSCGDEPITARGPARTISYEQLLLKNRFSASSVLCRRACIEEVGFFDERLVFRGVEDWDLWLRIVRRWPATYIPRRIVTIRSVEGSVSSLQNSEAMFRGELAVLASQAASAGSSSPGYLLMRRARSNRYITAAQDEMVKGHRWRSFSYVVIACLLYPPQVLQLRPWVLAAKTVIGP